MANPIHHPAHRVTVEPVTPALTRFDPGAVPGDLAVVERDGAVLVKICQTSDDLAGLARVARGAAWAYGATYTPAHPSTLAAPGDLAERAECLYDPELHTGPGEETPDQRAARVQAAREVCESCPVRDLCLPYALAARPATGVWAGHTADEITGLSARLVELGRRRPRPEATHQGAGRVA